MYLSPVPAGGTPVLFWPEGYPSPILAGGTPVLGYPLAGTGVPPPSQDWGTFQKGPETRDLGKNLGLGHPPGKDLGPETCDRTWDRGNPPSQPQQTD